MFSALDHAAGWTDDLINGAESHSLRQMIHRFGPPHGVNEPLFDTHHPDERQIGEMRVLAIEIRDRARAW